MPNNKRATPDLTPEQTKERRSTAGWKKLVQRLKINSIFTSAITWGLHYLRIDRVNLLVRSINWRHYEHELTRIVLRRQSRDEHPTHPLSY